MRSYARVPRDRSQVAIIQVGPEPPYHVPVFALTHHRHDPIQLDGGTTFHFITEGFDAAYPAAREAAGTTGWTSPAGPTGNDRK